MHHSYWAHALESEPQLLSTCAATTEACAASDLAHLAWAPQQTAPPMPAPQQKSSPAQRNLKTTQKQQRPSAAREKAAATVSTVPSFPTTEEEEKTM